MKTEGISDKYKLPFPLPPIWDLLGISVEEIGYGYTKLVMPFRQNLTQPYGIIHGGALFTLAESAAAVSLVAILSPNNSL